MSVSTIKVTLKQQGKVVDHVSGFVWNIRMARVDLIEVTWPEWRRRLDRGNALRNYSVNTKAHSIVYLFARPLSGSKRILEEQRDVLRVKYRRSLERLRDSSKWSKETLYGSCNASATFETTLPVSTVKDDQMFWKTSEIPAIYFSRWIVCNVCHVPVNIF